jgi:hypothetical protein
MEVGRRRFLHLSGAPASTALLLLASCASCSVPSRLCAYRCLLVCSPADCFWFGWRSALLASLHLSEKLIDDSGWTTIALSAAQTHQVAEALDKNYHTTRSLLRKMEEAGDIRQTNHQYVALTEATSCQQQHPAVAPCKQEESTGPIKEEAPACLDDTADAAVTAGDSSVVAPSAGHDSPDGGRATPVRQDASDGHPLQESNDIQQCREQGMGDDITMTHCQQGHQGEDSPPEKRDQSREDGLAAAGRASTIEESPAALLSKHRCPRHPRARWVRFDPSGQAWCDKLDCWDCYRLMKIGEALDYRCLTDLGGRVVIAQGMAAWSAFVVTQRVFLVVVATERAREICKTLGMEVPDLSEEAQHLVQVDPRPP